MGEGSVNRMYSAIACGVFEEEIERLIPSIPSPNSIRYIDPGLHVDFDQLEEALREALDECQERCVVAFGACHPRMDEILAPYGAVALSCQNCIDALIGREEMERRAELGLYFYLSPGWLKCWRDMFRRLGWGMEEARMELGPFKGAIYLDTLGDAEDRKSDLLEFFDYTLLCFEVVEVDLGHFRSLILDARDRLEV